MKYSSSTHPEKFQRKNMEHRPIPGFDAYEVNELGEIWSIVRKQYIGPSSDGRGYWNASLRKDGKTHSIKWHKVVALAWFGPKPEGYDIHHINGNKSDNRVANLRYEESHQHGSNSEVLAKRKETRENRKGKKLCAIQSSVVIGTYTGPLEASKATGFNRQNISKASSNLITYYPAVQKIEWKYLTDAEIAEYSKEN